MLLGVPHWRAPHHNARANQTLVVVRLFGRGGEGEAYNFLLFYHLSDRGYGIYNFITSLEEIKGLMRHHSLGLAKTKVGRTYADLIV